MHARNAAAVERISRRFADEEVRRSAAQAAAEVPGSLRVESQQRFEIVRRTQDPVRESPAAPAAPAARPMTAGHRTSWSPVPATAEVAAVEQYRRLAGAVVRAGSDHGARVFLVTSSLSGEGKSLTTANLAVTLARSYRRETLVIDADLRDPSLHEIFNAANSRGLSDYLRGVADAPAVMTELSPGLVLMSAGRPTSDPMGWLTSPRLQEFVARAADTFDVVLVDSPPVMLVPDAAMLAPLADAVILVIGAASTPYELIAGAVETIGRDRILGTVLNRAEPSSVGGRGYGYGYGYGYPRR